MKNIGIITILCIIIIIGCATSLLKANSFEEAEKIAIDIFWVYNDDIIDEIIQKFPNEPMAIWGTYNGEFSDEIASNYEVKMARHGLLVATRSRMRFINKEFDFQFSGMVNDNDIRSYGNMMGVSKIIIIESKQNGNYRDFSVLDIEKGVLLYSANIDLNIILENILIKNNLPINGGEANSVPGHPNTYRPFYIERPVASININFGYDLYYLGFRPSREQFFQDINDYFKNTIEPYETLLPQTYNSIENNIELDERVKNFMRSNNLTVCTTIDLNNYGGFIYIVNYSFDNYKSFGFISMDAHGYNLLLNGKYIILG